MFTCDMLEDIQGKDWFAAFRILVDQFSKHNHEIRVVGGAVRDILSGVSPHDIDICCTAAPDEIVDICKKEDIIYWETGIQHGTITVFKKRQVFEITSLRQDRLENDEKICVYGKSFEEDAKRRDFTINTMSMDVSCKVYDYFDGEADLKARSLKFTENADNRIKEDPLRILRYFRFMAREDLDFNMDESYLSLFERYSKRLEKVSGERIWSEISKILRSKKAGRVVSQMNQCQIFESIGMGTIPPHIIEDIDFSAQTPSCDKDIRVALVLGLLLRHDKAILEEVCTKWKVSKKTKLVSHRFCLDYIKHSTIQHKIEIYEQVYLNPEKFSEEHLTRLQYLKFDKAVLREVVTQDDIQEFEKFTLPTFPFSKEMFAKIPSFKSKQKPVLDRLRKLWVKSGFTMSLEDLMRKVES